MVIRGFEGINTVYNRGYRKPTTTSSGIGFRFVLNLKELVDGNAILKGLGITPIPKDEKEAFIPEN